MVGVVQPKVKARRTEDQWSTDGVTVGSTDSRSFLISSVSSSWPSKNEYRVTGCDSVPVIIEVPPDLLVT